MTSVRLTHLAKRFGSTIAVNDVNLEVRRGELLCLLGPSGCGKTTTLRMVGGFIIPDDGEIYFDDRRMTDVAPERRPTAMVFQSYALWPHMTTWRNVAFGLRVRHRPQREIEARVTKTLALVGLDGMGPRYPRELSGGQQQRVALARALVVEPEVLLLDEPLSNLDAKLRLRMRTDVRELQKRIGITMLYVTHDQEEALSISDRVAVMNDGRIEQLGTPQEVFQRPRTAFVAAFIGHGNLLPATVASLEADGHVMVRLADGTLLRAGHQQVMRTGDEVRLAIQAHQVVLSGTEESNCLCGRIRVVLYLGTSNRVEVDTSAGRLVVDVPVDTAVTEGDDVRLHLPQASLLALGSD